MACLLFGSFIVPATAQSTLSLTAVIDAAGVAEGIAVVNPTTGPAPATFTLYSSSGATMAVSTQTIPASGQFSKLKSELFPGQRGGWIQITSNVSGLQGFWVAGDFVTAVDGAEAATPRTDQTAPVAGNSGLLVVNTGTSSVSVTLQLYGADGAQLNFIGPNGQSLSSIIRTLEAHAVLDTDAEGICPLVISGCSGSPSLARSVRITSSAPVAAGALVQPFSGTNIKDNFAVTNAMDSSSAPNQLNFPHVVHGLLQPASYATLIGVTNTTSASQNVSITFRDEGAAAITVQRTISARGTLQETAASLFSFSTTFRNGWVQVTGSGGLTGFVAYADLNGGGVTIVAAQASPALTFLFAHIADLPPWWTGLALLNPNTGAATVEVFAMNSDGSLIGGADNVATARLTIAGQTKTARLLDELIPQAASRSSDGGFVFIRSSVPLIGIQLFFLRSGVALANVGANYLPTGITYTPPLR